MRENIISDGEIYFCVTSPYTVLGNEPVMGVSNKLHVKNKVDQCKSMADLISGSCAKCGSNP